jgi:hypothetical protein
VTKLESWNKTRINIPFKPCGQSHFSGFDPEKIGMYKIDQFLCMSNVSSFELQGDFYSPRFRYLEIRLYKCINSTSSKIVCKS